MSIIKKPTQTPIVLGDRTDNYLAKAILLEEATSPRFTRVTIGLAGGLIIAFIVWASIARLETVAVALGEVVPSGAVQVVQHLDGGRIKEINVKDGQVVQKGDILLSLNPIDARSDLEGLTARARKLKSEVNYLRDIANIRGDLAKDKLVTRTQALDAQRNLAAVEGEYDRTVYEIEKLQERLSRIQIVSPVNGIVQDLKYRTVGGVIAPGATVLNIVPTDDVIHAEIRVSTQDVGHVREGQLVRVKVSTYDFMRYGIIEGKVSVVSAFSSLDEKTQQPYFKTIVSLPRRSMGKTDQDLPILPGMTVQGDIVTDRQTVLRYLLRPIYVAFSQGMRER
jgi:membrane fusion protein, adhesin transport system